MGDLKWVGEHDRIEVGREDLNLKHDQCESENDGDQLMLMAMELFLVLMVTEVRYQLQLQHKPTSFY